MQKNIHFIGIGGIGISAVARYYKALWYTISGSDGSDSTLLQKLKNEGMVIYVGHDAAHLPSNTELVIYTEAIVTKPDLSKEENLTANPELSKARELWLRNLSYPEALAEIVNSKKCIAIAGSHGKSTTTAMVGIMLKDSVAGGSTIVGTQVPQLNNSNFYFEESDYFTIEACEYKRSFLKYHPYISIITNIDLDHLDYYKDIADYISAFQTFQDQTSGYVILDGTCINSAKLKDPRKKQLWVYDKYYIDEFGNHNNFPEFDLQVPGKHIEFDAKLAYVAGKLVGLEDEYIVKKLNSYQGSWRRSEIVKTTKNGNLLMSDYGHHPSEIAPTLEALKGKYSNKKLFVVFQPHQHSRTRELLDGFTTCFDAADQLVIPNIYFSRDKEEDVKYMTTERLVERLSHNYPHIINGQNLDNSAQIIRDYDEKKPNSSVILILGAGNVDDLRYKID